MTLCPGPNFVGLRLPVRINPLLGPHQMRLHMHNKDKSEAYFEVDWLETLKEVPALSGREEGQAENE